MRQCIGLGTEVSFGATPITIKGFRLTESLSLMSRGLDHVVHAVRDLDAAADAYRRLGFTVGARNAHPWGTHNRIVQLPGFFIELLTVAEPEKIPPAEPGGFSFGAFQHEFLA